MNSITELSFGYWLLFIASLLAIIIICSVLYLFVKNKRRHIMIVGIILLCISISVFFSLPYQIKKQVNTSVTTLNAYLSTTYLSDSWSITHTDPDQLEKTIILHVRFSNEQKIVYEYKLKENSINLSNYWGINGESSSELKQAGIIPRHIK